MASHAINFDFDSGMNFDGFDGNFAKADEGNTSSDFFFGDEGIDTTMTMADGALYDTINPDILSTPQDAGFGLQQNLTLDNTMGSSIWQTQPTTNNFAMDSFPSTSNQSFDCLHQPQLNSLGKRPLQIGNDFPQAKRHEAFSPFLSKSTSASGSSWSLENQNPMNTSTEIGLSDEAAEVCATWFNRFAVLPSDRHIESLSQLTGEPATAVRQWFGQLLKQGLGSSDSAYKSQTGLPANQMLGEFTQQSSSGGSCNNDSLNSDTPNDDQLATAPSCPPANTVRGGKRGCAPTDDPELLCRDPNKIFQCTRKCGKRYGRKCDWKRNEEEYYPAKSFVCSLCTFQGVEKVKPCFRKYHLLQHFKNIHQNEDAEQYVDTSIVDLNNEFPRKCGFCRWRFVSRQQRIDHIADHFKDGKCMLDWNDDWEETDDSDAADDNDDNDDHPGNDGFGGSKPYGEPRGNSSRDGFGSGFFDGDSGSGGQQPPRGGFFQFQLGQSAHKDNSGQCSRTDQRFDPTFNQPDEQEHIGGTSVCYEDIITSSQCPLNGRHAKAAGDDLDAVARDVFTKSQVDQDLSGISIGQLGRDLNHEAPITDRLFKTNSQWSYASPSRSTTKSSQIQTTEERRFFSLLGERFQSSRFTKEDVVNILDLCNIDIGKFASIYERLSEVLSQVTHDHVDNMTEDSSHPVQVPIPLPPTPPPMPGDEKIQANNKGKLTNCSLSMDNMRRCRGSPDNSRIIAQLGVHDVPSDAKCASKTQSLSLEKLPLDITNVENSLSFGSIKLLGTGGFSTVDEVVHRQTKLRLSRKTLKNREHSAVQELKKEVDVLKKLRHPHIVRCLGDYANGEKMSMLLSPVAETTLEVWLNQFNSQVPAGLCQTILKMFGCLLSSVRYLHEQRPVVQHGDIKPQNILIMRGDQEFPHVLLSDFGISSSQDIVDGSSVPLTRKYCAPEVPSGLNREQYADIWSLGCVLIEAISFAFGETNGQWKELRREFAGRSDKCYWQDVEGLHDRLSGLHKQATESIEKTAVSSAISMLNVEPSERPSAAALMLTFTPAPCCLDWPNDRTIFPGPRQELQLAEKLARECGANIAPQLHSHSGNGLKDEICSHASGWLNGCIEGHESCRQQARHAQHVLPTRLVDLQPECQAEAWICIVNSAALENHDKIVYAAISHTWSDIEMKTLSEHRSALHSDLSPGAFPCETLPKALNYALSTASSMGYRYVWIDSLCVLQDSEEDKRRECLHMSTIFRNSDITIIVDQLDTTKKLSASLPAIDFCSPGFSWDTRAWSLQERLLSRRLLHLGAEQMYWCCNSLKASETFPRGLPALIWEKIHTKFSSADEHMTTRSILTNNEGMLSTYGSDVNANGTLAKITSIVRPHLLKDCQWIRKEGDGIGDSMEAAQINFKTDILRKDEPHESSEKYSRTIPQYASPSSICDKLPQIGDCKCSDEPLATNDHPGSAVEGRDICNHLVSGIKGHHNNSERYNEMNIPGEVIECSTDENDKQSRRNISC